MTPEPTPTPEQIQKARELLSFEGKSERLSPIALVARLLARAEAAERERDALAKVVAGEESDKDSVLAMLMTAAVHNGNGPCEIHRSHVLNVLARIERFEKERDQWREDAKVLAANVNAIRNWIYGPDVMGTKQIADDADAATDASGALTRAGGGK